MICSICNQNIIEKRFQTHYERCSEILSHIDEIIQLYKTNVPSIEKLCKIYKCDYYRLKNIIEKYDSSCFIKEDNINHSFLKNPTKFAFWFIGLMASDGCINKNNNVVSIGQSGDDGLKLVNYICDILEYKGSIHKTHTYRKPYYFINFSSIEMKNDLSKYNIIANKTYTYKYPKEKINRDMLKYFLLGYIEGDGSISIQNNGKNCFYLNTSFVGTYDFIIAIGKELKLIDEKFNFNIHKSKHSSVYELRFLGKGAQYFCKWLFSDDDMYKSYKFFNYKKSLTETLQNSKNRELKNQK